MAYSYTLTLVLMLTVFVRLVKKKTSFSNVKVNSSKTFQKEEAPCESRTHIFDDDLYKDKSVIEHSNAWIDGFKALLVRFEFSLGRLSGQKMDVFTFHIILNYFFTQNQRKNKNLNGLVL